MGWCGNGQVAPVGEKPVKKSRDLHQSMGLRYRLIEDPAELGALKTAWQALHAQSSSASVYNSFDYIRLSTQAIAKTGLRYFILCVYHQEGRDQEGQDQDSLIGIFPFHCVYRHYRKIRLRKLNYATYQDVDKPYPLLRADVEWQAWRGLFEYLQQHHDAWDFLQLNELPCNVNAVLWLEQLCREHGLVLKTQAESQARWINLRQWQWPDFLQQFADLKQAVRRLHRRGGAEITFSVERVQADRWREALGKYLDLEARSRPQGGRLIGHDARSLAFYQPLFASLSQRGKLVFGFLSAKQQIIAGIIAYIEDEVAYCAHASCDDAYAEWQLGMVNAGYFVEYCLNHGLKSIDFHCGEDDFYQRWADRVETTLRLDIYRKTPRVRCLLALNWLAQRLKVLRLQK